MASAALQLQWAMDTTSFTTLHALKSLISAASSDNVQPGAIIACEGLGATLAMCEITTLKIQQKVCPAPTPAVLGWVKASVGYARGDAMSQLDSQAGHKFLALACALATTDPRQGTRAVHALISESASEKTLVPTFHQVGDLLAAIHPRCVRGGFAEEVLGWRVLFARLLRDRDNSPRASWDAFDYQLIDGGVKSMVSGLREICRIGDARATKLVVYASLAAPWIAAFTKWCLGTPPSVMLDDGQVLLSSPDSKVELVMPLHGDTRQLDIKVYNIQEHLSTLISTRDCVQVYTGLTSVAAYGKTLLSHYGLDDELAVGALVQGLSYGLRRVCRNLIAQGSPEGTAGCEGPSKLRLNGLPLDVCQASIRFALFTDERAAVHAANCFLGATSIKGLQELDSGKTIFDLPLVIQLVERAKTECRCCRCSSSGPLRYRCSEEVIHRTIEELMERILVVSLFESPADLLITTRETASQDFGSNVIKALGQDIPVPCQIEYVIKAALTIVNHKTANLGEWIMSSGSGQVVWPAIYEYTTMPKASFLRFFWAQGNILFQGDKYNLIRGPRTHTIDASTAVPDDYDVLSSANRIFGDISLRWNLTRCGSVLEAIVAVADPTGMFSHVTADPTRVLYSLADALFINGCKHDAEAAPQDTQKSYRVLNPFRTLKTPKKNILLPIGQLPRRSVSIDVHDSSDDENDGYRQGGAAHRRLRVLPMGRNAAVQFIALAKNRFGHYLVIREGSCLQCAMDVCREYEYSAVIA